MEKLQSGGLGDVLTASLNTAPHATSSDCVNFDFDIKILEVKGSVCKSGKLDVRLYVAGIEVAHPEVDLSKGEWCTKLSVGVEEVKVCFYIKGSCLYTKGYVDGWFHPKESWDAEIICF